ncbi:MAG: DJ-1/PfpI family protein [Rudaea sp.]|uniref:GlxA family transcriptional regulator n=1 Tax=unclassified Rudaea TaxID=2627037 RepID=UPI0010F8DFCD|nr:MULTISPECIES: DJ-1/PfpI family protein [unclassified Rudaea]MBN8885016.1 DJ-1/PfpI family protein [Rudaea sp.]MBR0344419.1 DJ-1/PfpI family protein [Rudaea sp.]
MKHRLTLGLLGLACLQTVVAAEAPRGKLVPPERGSIPVAFVLSEGAVMIDFAGPWEVFQDTMVPARGSAMADQHVFTTYVVSDTKKPLHTSGGMTVTPDYTFDDAPAPKIVVVPAQQGSSAKMLEWLRKAAGQSDVVMSVCTGAFKLAEAGLLEGKDATTHHGSYVHFQHQFPQVHLVRDRRYVQSDAVLYTAGGLSSGIDLALHIVDGYFGHDVAAMTARQMEYEGRGWSGGGASAVRYSEPVAVTSPADSYHSGTFGNWRGELASPNGALRIRLHLWPAAAGAAATIDSIDDDTYGLHIDTVKIDGANLHFEITGIGGVYEGKIDASRGAIEGTWTQNGKPMALKFKRS